MSGNVLSEGVIAKIKAFCNKTKRSYCKIPNAHSEKICIDTSNFQVTRGTVQYRISVQNSS